MLEGLMQLDTGRDKVRAVMWFIQGISPCKFVSYRGQTPDGWSFYFF